MFDDLGVGRYTITVTDLTGRIILNKAANIAAKVQAEKVQLKTTLAKGMYLVKVSDANQKLIFTERIVVQ